MAAYFDYVFLSAELEAAKPDRKFFEHVKQRLTTEDLVFVSHRGERDLQPAKNTGFKTILTQHTDELPYTDAAITGLDALPQAVDAVIR